MYIGGDNVEKLYIGDTEVEKVYLGTDVIYEKVAPTPTGGIHLTSDGMGIVFPAGTYQNEDGNPDFREYTSSGSTQSDSVTFSEDVTFPYEYHTEDWSQSVRYDWHETNNVYHSGTFTPIDAVSYGWTYVRTDSDSANYTSADEITPVLSWDSSSKNVTLAGAGLPYIGYSGSSYSNFYLVDFKLIPDSGFYSYEWGLTVTSKDYHNGGSYFRNNAIWQVDICGSDGTVKETLSRTDSGSTTVTHTISVSNHAPLSPGDYFKFSQSHTTTNTGFYYQSTSYSEMAPPSQLTGGAPTVSGYYYSIEPKVVKLGLSGHSFSGEGYSDKSIQLGEDSRPGWDLGYVKFSGSEVGKLVQYSKNPIT